MKRWPSIFRTLPWGIIQPNSGIFRTLCNACIHRNVAYSESWNIQNTSIIAYRRITIHIYENLRIFKTLTCLKPETYSELSKKFKMEFFAKIVKNDNYFSKALHLRSLNGFWICLSLNKYSLTSRETSWNVLYDICSEPGLSL